MTHLVPVIRPVLGTPFRRDSLYRRAGAMPSFHIAPARTQTAADLITGSVLGTYNSATPAMAVGPDGVLFQPAANAPVIEYDPVTLACLGARVWGVVLNQIRNSIASGAVAGTPGTAPTNWAVGTSADGLTREIVGTGQSAGIDYIDVRYYGTATATGSRTIQAEGPTAVTAATGQSWTASTYVFVIGGSTSGVTSLQQRISGRSSAGSLLENTNTVIPLAASFATSRVSASMTFANASTARATSDIVISYSNGAVIDITLRIGLPQLTQTASMGPVVRTTGTSASSTADVWDLTNLAAGANNIRSLYARVRTPASGTSGIISLNDNSSSNRIALQTTGTSAKLVAVTSGSTVADITGGTISANTVFNIAARIVGDDYAVSVNGSPVVTDTAGARAVVDRIFFGRTQAGEYLNGYIEECLGWTQALTNQQVQASAS